MRTEGTHEHLVFVWTPAGYALETRHGEPPPRGAAIQEGDRRHRVTKVAPSPLPGDARECAYLLPTDGEPTARLNGDAATDAPVAEPVVLTLVPEPESRTETDDADDLLALLGTLPQGTCVVTVDAQGRRIGLTVGSLVSLSLDPPLVGFTTPADEVIARLIPVAGGCAISLLAGGQEWLADYFETSERPIAMWHALGAEPGAVGAPLFVGALGWLECSLVDTVDLGSHLLFVCEVKEGEVSVDAPALARVHGRYGVVFERVDGPSMLDVLMAKPWLVMRLAAQPHERSMADQLEDCAAHQIPRRRLDRRFHNSSEWRRFPRRRFVRRASGRGRIRR